ncbi:unnamed protein product [Penicillium bialowiezense]
MEEPMVLAVLLKEVDVLLNEVDEQLIQLDKLKQSKADNLHPNTTCPEKAEILEDPPADASVSISKPVPSSNNLNENADERVALQVWSSEIENQLTLLSDRQIARALAVEDERDEGCEEAPVPKISPTRWISQAFWKMLASIKRHWKSLGRVSWINLKSRDSKSQVCICCSKAQEGLQVKCSHFYCNSCLIYMVTISLKGETSFPPQCCQQPFTGSRMKKAIGSALYCKIKERKIEINDPQKTYCASVKCGRYIAPKTSSLWKTTRETVSTCECGVRTCRECKSFAHAGICVNMLDEAFEKMKVVRKWQDCYKCGRTVERIDGCRNMT